jgi:hypothetical protein
MAGNSDRSGVADATLRNDVVQDLNAFRVIPEVRALVEAAGTRVRFTSRISNHYVSLSTQSGGHIASYVHRERLTVALPPSRAAEVSGEYKWKLKPRSGVTSYVQIPSGGLASEAQRSVALNLLVEAIKWRTLST